MGYHCFNAATKGLILTADWLIQLDTFKMYISTLWKDKQSAHSFYW